MEKAAFDVYKKTKQKQKSKVLKNSHRMKKKIKKHVKEAKLSEPLLSKKATKSGLKSKLSTVKAKNGKKNLLKNLKNELEPQILEPEENGETFDNKNKNGDKRKCKKKNSPKKLKNNRERDVRNFEENDNDENPFPVVIPEEQLCESSQEEEPFYDTPQNVFNYLIAPINSEDFFSNYWEKDFLHVVRKSETFYKDILSSEILDGILRHNPLYYTKNIDVVTYENDERKTHNPEGRAVPASVWDYYTNGCSVRLLNPQTYNKKVRHLLAVLQEYFGSMVGANVYLTPAGSQGFAPHYDDIEAFVLQLEGRKHWKIYKPIKEENVLPRFSSRNFMRNELGTAKSVTLEVGDLLYFPRGFVHEAYTDSNSHSLHITVSVYQNTSYVDLIEKTLMNSLRDAAASDVKYRRGLPIQYLKHVGASNADLNTETRTEVINTVKKLVKKLSDYISVDDGADQLARKFMHDSLPPHLHLTEKLRTCSYDGDVLINGTVYNRGVFEPDTYVRLTRYHCLRLVVEDGANKLYYSTENANVYHGEEEQFLELNSDIIEAIKTLIRSYPDYLKIEELPAEDQVYLMHVISDLWEKGLIVTKKPLSVYGD